MRRALGLRGSTSPSEGSPQPNIGSHSPRHDLERRARRFVRDGEVPVVVLGRTRDPALPVTAAPSNRVQAAESALQAERAARERAERALHEAQESIQHLQTQLGHANLAHAEALATERLAREAAERAAAEALAVRTEIELRLASAPQPPPSAPVVVRKARLQRKTEQPARTAQPVKWWLSTAKSGRQKG